VLAAHGVAPAASGTAIPDCEGPGEARTMLPTRRVGSHQPDGRVYRVAM
jgi:hypothetical protein